MYNNYNKSVKNRFRKMDYNYRGPRFQKNLTQKKLIKKLLGQLIISIIIVVLIILLKSINTPITDKASLFIKNTVFAQYEYKEGINSIIDHAIDLKDKTLEAVPVFNNKKTSKQFIKPIEGIVVSDFGEKYNPITEKVSFQKGIHIKAIDMNIVKSIDDGVVEITGNGNKGKLVKIKHSENVFSLYSNLDKILVNKGQRVLKGERIGEIDDIENTLLNLEIWVDGEPVDPQEYIDYGPISI